MKLFCANISFLLRSLVVLKCMNEINARIGIFPPIMNLIPPLSINRSNDLWRLTKGIDEIEVLNYGWDVKWFRNMPVDHFNYQYDISFQVKYLTNYSYFQCGGPMFFYAGNEGDIETFAKITGIMWDLAPQFHAALVFAEHRYYGETKPFGRKSYSDVKLLGYLNEIQALADFARIITDLKNDQNELGHCPEDVETPVIVFGGSYGGMLAAWLRMKYPHVVDGAWASSAPLRLFYGTEVSPDRVSRVLTANYLNSGCDRTVFLEGFAAIERLSETVMGREKLDEIFRSPPGFEMESPADFFGLYSYISAAIFSMAMTDYPYPANFLAHLPGNPVKYACQYAREAATTDEGLAEQLYKIINVYYNYTGELDYNCFIEECSDLSPFHDNGDEIAWKWQSCTSLTIQNCDRGDPNDFFLNNCNDSITNNIKSCIEYFEEIGYSSYFYRLTDIRERYGLKYNGMSNIIFSNGNLDPWSAGGIYEDAPGIVDAMKNGVYIFNISGAAHHLDLRTPNTCDPPSVVHERFQVVGILSCWIYKNCTQLPISIPLRDNIGWRQPTKCQFIRHGYPWGERKPEKGQRSVAPTLLTLIVTIATIIISEPIA